MTTCCGFIKDFSSSSYHRLLDGVEVVGALPTRAVCFVNSCIFRKPELAYITFGVSCLFRGSVYALTSVASLGTRKNSVKTARTSLEDFGGVVSCIYDVVLRLLNSSAEIPHDVDKDFNWCNEKIDATNKTLEDANAGTFQKEVISRCIYVSMVIPVIVQTIFKILIGTIAVPLSLLTLGRFSILNEYAYRSLQAPLIVARIFTCLMGSINPYSLSERTVQMGVFN